MLPTNPTATTSGSASPSGSGTASPDLTASPSGSASPGGSVTPGGTPTPGGSGTPSVAQVSCTSVTPIRIERSSVEPRRTTEVVTLVSDGRNLTPGTREQTDFSLPVLTAPDAVTTIDDQATIKKIADLIEGSSKNTILLTRPEPPDTGSDANKRPFNATGTYVLYSATGPAQRRRDRRLLRPGAALAVHGGSRPDGRHDQLRGRAAEGQCGRAAGLRHVLLTLRRLPSAIPALPPLPPLSPLPPLPPLPLAGRPSQMSLHSGQTGNRCGSRLGTQTLPQSATTGVPITIASVSFSLGT